VIDLASNTVLPTSIAVGAQPTGIAVTPDGKFVYVTNQSDNTVSVINVANNTVLPISIPVGAEPIGIALTPDGKFAYVANFGSNTVSVINTATNTVLASQIAVGSGPAAFGSFIGPNIIVAQGGPLLIANDSALTPLGFGQFVDFNGGTLKTTGSLATSRTISLLDGGGTIDTNGFDSTLSGNIINSGSLTKVGAGTLTLSGNNSYSGGTNLVGGILSVTSDSNLGTGNIGISNNAELLTTGPFFVSTKEIALGTGGGTLASVTGAIAQYEGVISGSGPLTVGDTSNAGTIILSGSNTYSGGTRITGGVLSVRNDSNLGTGNITILNGSELLTTGQNFATSKAIVLGNGGGSLASVTGSTATYAGAINGVGGLTIGDAMNGGTIVLTGNNSYSGATTVSSGALRAGSTSALSSNSAFTVNSVLDLNGFSSAIGSLSGTGTVLNKGSAPAMLTVGSDNTSTVFSGMLTDWVGALGLIKVGGGTLTLAGFNVYSGPTSVNSGVLQAGSSLAFSPNSAFTVASTLDLNGFSNAIGSLSGSGVVTNSGTAAAALTVGYDNTNTVFGGTLVDGTSALQLTKIGSGTLTLSGTNTYSGGTLISGGALQIGNGGTTGSIGGNVTNNGSLVFNRSDSFTFNGVISGTGRVNQNGTGTTILGGNNSYAGGTAINAGTLVVNSAQALGLGGVTVNQGVLTANSQPIYVQGNYAQNAGGTLQLQIAGSNPGQYDSLIIAGNATLGGTLQLTSLGYQPKAGDRLNLLAAGGAISGRFARFLDPFTAGPGFNTIDLVYGRDTVQLQFLNTVHRCPRTRVRIRPRSLQRSTLPHLRKRLISVRQRVRSTGSKWTHERRV